VTRRIFSESTLKKITQDELNIFQVLHTLLNPVGPAVPSVSAGTATQKDNLGTRAYNICGWAHLPPQELDQLHECNGNGWTEFNNASNRCEREAVIEAYFIQPLVKQQPRFRQILKEEFRVIIIGLTFAPQNIEGNKPNGGLGPLIFVPLSMIEQENIEHFRTINARTNNPSAADIERMLPGTTKLPDNVDALITLLP
jgi:hypothetical protein